MPERLPRVPARSSILPAVAHINRIGTAVPPHEVHGDFLAWAEGRLGEPRDRALFRRMARWAGIGRRWSVLAPGPEGSAVAPGGFYAVDPLPSTAARMDVYAAEAPALALKAIAQLGDLGEISHLVVASCTGFVAPGIDQIVAAALDLPGTVERTLVGFMGCYAAVAALRQAYHIVRSEPAARVLVVTVELSTLHLQPAGEVEPLLAMLLFGDGAAAAIVSAETTGLAIEAPFAATLPGSAGLIRWTIGDTGFAMHLAGEVPQRISAALGEPAFVERITGGRAADGWAVHAGGRSVLDAVESALHLPDDALTASRSVLMEHGNMSSSTLMFILARFLDRRIGHGVAIAFGPGLAAEGFRFRSAQ